MNLIRIRLRFPRITIDIWTDKVPSLQKSYIFFTPLPQNKKEKQYKNFPLLDR